MRLLALTSTVIAILFLATNQLGAAPITYTETATIYSGTLGTASISGASVTLTFVGDTSNVTQLVTGFYVNEASTATITIGPNTYIFTSPMEVFDGQVVPYAGTADYPAGNVIVAVDDSAFASYDLTTAIGPITDAGGVGGAAFPTSGGNLTISSIEEYATFTASTTVPEPSTLLLLSPVLAGLWVWGRKKFKRI